MRTRTGIIKRTATLGLAVWFAALAVYVQGPHGHRAVGRDTRRDASHSRIFARAYAPDATLSVPSLVTSDKYQDDYCGDSGYCLACLFLKNCKERAVVWKSPVPGLPADDHALYRDPLHRISAVVVSSSPRAPPVPLV